MSLLRGLLRRHHPHPRRPGEERGAGGGARGGRPRRGTLCPKGATLKDDITHRGRLLSPKVRRPGSDHWEDISWDEAIAKIARHVKDTRDRTFVARNAKGEVVNRTPGIAMIGGCTDTNEFNFLQWKVVTALGVPYRDTQARV